MIPPYGKNEFSEDPGDRSSSPLSAASPSRRFWAMTIDHLSAAFLGFGLVICAQANPASSEGLPTSAWMVTFIVFVINTVVLQGMTGLSFGRIVTHTRAVEEQRGTPRPSAGWPCAT